MSLIGMDTMNNPFFFFYVAVNALLNYILIILLLGTL